MPTLEELVTDIADLRPLSSTALNILNLTGGERFSAHELAILISSDQALTAKMLRLANSAYYGFPRRIATVRDAVVLLGFRAVRSATLATCLADANPGSNHLNDQEFWHHSVSVGMLAEVLARAEGAHQDEAFTAGVIHDIGRLALDQHLPNVFQAAIMHAQAAALPLHEAQRQILGYDDADIGGALAERWNFPQPLVEAARDHYLDPNALPAPASLTAFVVRARVFARSYGLPDGLDRPEPGETPADWTRPPVSVQLRLNGGVDGIMEQVSAFLEAAVTL